jgi:radical SAM protein with 4Fe4S-binding SPASM domain
MNDNVYTQLSKYLDKHSHIRIAGGEPLLVFDKWKIWAKQYDSVEVLSNFRVIPNDYFEYNYNTSVSIDGYGAKPLDELIKRNVKKLKGKPWIMTTLHDGENLTKIANFVAENNYGWAISTDYFCQDQVLLKNTVPTIKKAISILKDNKYDFNQFLFNNLDWAGRGGCDAGNKMFAVDCDGKIYPCHTQLNKKPTGDIWEGFKTQTYKHKTKICKGCSINHICTGWCTLHHKKGNDVCKLMKLVTWEVLYNN